MTATDGTASAWGGAWLVVGLGNPGPGYAGNRHNVGHMVVDELAQRHRARWHSHTRSRAVLAETRVGALPGIRAILAKPMSYMNQSGGPTKAVSAYFGVEPAGLVVVHDELDIPFGAVRLKKSGGEGGHNGLRSISTSLGTPDYYRLRVGIDRPPGSMLAADYVLRDFAPPQRRELTGVVAAAADAVEDLISAGLQAAQQRWHLPR